MLFHHPLTAILSACSGTFGAGSRCPSSIYLSFSTKNICLLQQDARLRERRHWTKTVAKRQQCAEKCSVQLSQMLILFICFYGQHIHITHNYFSIINTKILTGAALIHLSKSVSAFSTHYKIHILVSVCHFWNTCETRTALGGHIALTAQWFWLLLNGKSHIGLLISVTSLSVKQCREGAPSFGEMTECVFVSGDNLSIL